MTLDTPRAVPVLAFSLASMVLLLHVPAARAGSISVNFEGISDSTVLTNQIAGLTFSNASVITSSLNDIEFPPHSGSGVALDSGGPVTISFDLAQLNAASVTGVSAFFTYTAGLKFEAFDAGNVSLGSVTSAFGSNFVSSGNPPNELLHISATGIRSVTITGDPAGQSFVMDDLTVDFADAQTSVTPEPVPAALAAFGLAGLGLARVRSSRRNSRRARP